MAYEKQNMLARFDLGTTYWDGVVGAEFKAILRWSKKPDEPEAPFAEYYCKSCQKIYRRVNGHVFVFCGGCKLQFNTFEESKHHMCEGRRKLSIEAWANSFRP